MKKRRPRRTNEEITQAIHHAVLSIVKRKGFGGLTFEGVARRCRMSKPVLYRRYANRADMYLDAINLKRLNFTYPQPSGSLRDDLTACFEAYQKAWIAAPAAYRALIGEASPETLAKVTAFETLTARFLMKEIIKPAIDRRDLGCFPLDDEVVMVPLRVLRDHFIFNGKPVDIFWLVNLLVIPLLYVRTGWVLEWKRIGKELAMKDCSDADPGQNGEKSVSFSPES